MAWLLIHLALFGGEPAEPVLRFPSDSGPSTIRFSFTLGAQTVEQVWSEFLEHWKARFDTNHDGLLDRDEASVVPALTNAAGAPIRLDILVADSDGDGLINLEELKNFYRSRGFSHINPVATTIDSTAIQAGESLWELLDRDDDGLLSKAELAAITQLLNRWDRNEDECLNEQELPTRPVPQSPQLAPVIDWSPEQPADTIIIPLQFNSLSGEHSDGNEQTREPPMQFEPLSGKRVRLRLPSTNAVLHLSEASVQRVVAAQQYLLGEIDAVRADSSVLDVAQIQAETTLDWLLPLMNAVDSDQNHKLTESEIKEFVGLLAEGAAAQVSIAVVLRGRSLFDWLDTNADGQLNSRELITARTLIETHNDNDVPSNPIESLSRDHVPWSIVIEIRRGPYRGRFGRLRIARRPIEVTASHSTSIDLPRWFTAMDRNRDLTLSPSEFLGPPERFKQLDLDSDGVITSEEILLR